MKIDKIITSEDKAKHFCDQKFALVSALVF